MDYDFDPEKSRINFDKHKVSFEYAARIFQRTVLEWVDARQDYGETRFIAVGRVNGDTLTVVYTWRSHKRRLISARKASKRERDAYDTKTG